MELAENRRMADGSYLDHISPGHAAQAGTAVEVGAVVVPGQAPDGEARRTQPVDPDLETNESAASRLDPLRHRRAQRDLLLTVGIGGAFGALARYAFGRLLPSPTGHFPWSTFWINMSGSLVLGFVIVLLTNRFIHVRLVRPFIATGFIGAYTTFSTYTVDTDTLFHTHHIATGVIYALSSLFGGGAAAFFGVVSARGVLRLGDGPDEPLG